MSKKNKISKDVKKSINWLEIIKAKLKWAIEEKAKGIKLIKETQYQIAKIEGIILLANDLINPKKKENKS